MNYLCSACGRTVDGDMIIYLDHTNKHVIDLLKNDHPEWKEKDGVCKPCVDFYKREIDGSVFKDAPCALRIRKTNKIFKSIKKMFGAKV